MVSVSIAGVSSINAINAYNSYQGKTPARADKKKPFAETKVKTATVDMLTLNTYLRTKPLGKDIFKRADRIASTMKNYDVVGLQETFSGDSKHINKTIKDSHPSQYRHEENRILTNSGLSSFSKYKMVEKDFKAFHYSTGSDSLAKKGVMFTRFDVPNVGQIDVYNTHLQAGRHKKRNALDNFINWFIPGYNWQANDVKLSQVRELTDFVKSHDVGNPTFVMGDFNSMEGDRQYQELMNNLKSMGLKDSYRVANPDAPGYTSDGKVNGIKKDNGSTGQKRIDFIFYSPGQNHDVEVKSSQVTHNRAINGMWVSDHFGVHSSFQISKKD